MLTAEHLCLVMELAAGGTLMHHVSDRHARARPGSPTPGLSEDEACYYFTVSRPCSCACSCSCWAGLGCTGLCLAVCQHDEYDVWQSGSWCGPYWQDAI